MKVLRYILAAALAAALFVLAAPAAADCPPDDPACHLTPPQSRQVNPDPVFANDGSSVLGSSPSLNVTDFTSPLSVGDGSGSSPVAHPAFVVPLPLRSSPDAPDFDTLDLRLRYQSPSDVSCGVQALGMALDGLGSPAPASSALLGYLQGNGMMYDFGTGVEELAFTAQSFGYADSLPFHGGSLSLLSRELAAGRPVVVDLGANGDGAPGHFVTVTGISPDGGWVALDDPVLGKQTLSTADFLATWGLQGYSGVTVGGGPAAAAVSTGSGSAPNPLNASPLLLLIAGLMALISNAGLGRWREGIGGIVAAGTGGGGGSTYAPPKAISSKSSKSKSSKKKTKSSSKNKAKTAPTKPASKDPGGLLNGLISSAANAASSVVSRGKGVVSSVVTRIGNAVDQATASVLSAVSSGVDQVKAEASAAATAVTSAVGTSIAKVQSEMADLRGAPHAAATPQPTAQATPGASRAPGPPEPQVTPGPRVSSQLSNVQPATSQPDDAALPDLPDNFLDPFPSIVLPYVEKDIVSLSLFGLLEWGHQFGWAYDRDTDGSTTLTPYSWSQEILRAKLQFSSEKLSLKATLPFGKTTAYQTDDGSEITFQQSVSMEVAWNGWNTTTDVAYNAQDYTIAGGSDLTDDSSVSGHQGIYVKEKPYQIVAGLAAVQAGAGMLALGYGYIAPIIAGLVGKGLSVQPAF